MEAWLLNPGKKVKRVRQKKSLRKQIKRVAKRIVKAVRRRVVRHKKRSLVPLKRVIKNLHKRSKTMAHKRKAGSRKHRLAGFGSRGSIMVSPLSRLAPHSRGMRLNPFINLDIKETGIDLVSALVGFTGVKLIPQYVLPMLGQTNDGYMKYVGQAGTAVILYMVTDKVLKKPRVAKMILIGSLLGIATELLSTVLPMSEAVGLYISPEEIAKSRNTTVAGLAGAGKTQKEKFYS
jgi:hypothetical protein